MKQYRISELNLEIETNSQTLSKNLTPFETQFDYKPNLSLSISEDLLAEYAEEYGDYTLDEIENIYLSTEFARSLFDFNGFAMQCTAVEHNDAAILFASPVENVNPYEQLPHDKVFCVDYPAVRLIGKVFFAYDTPFGLNGDKAKAKKLPIKSIVFVDSERFSNVGKMDTKDMVYLFIRAVTASLHSDRTKHTLFMLEKLMHVVDFYGVSDLSDIDTILDTVS